MDFPDSMSQEQIVTTIQKNGWGGKQKQPEHGMVYNGLNTLLNAPLPSEQYRSQGDGLADSAYNALLDFGDAPTRWLRGAGKGAINTAAGIGSFANKYLGATIPVNQENLKDLTETHGFNEGFGNFAEQTAEYMLGEGLAKAGLKAGVKASPLLARIASNSKLGNTAVRLGRDLAANTVVAGAQSGGDPVATGLGGVVLPLAGHGVGAVAGRVKQFVKDAGAGKALSPEAQTLANQANIPLRQSDLDGSALTRRVEDVTGHSGAMDIYQKQEHPRQQGLNALALNLAGTDSGEAVSNDIMDQLRDQTGQYRNEANQHYKDWRSATDANKQRVQVRTKTEIDPNTGVKTKVPVFANVATPVDIQQVKATMKPVYKRMRQVLKAFPSHDFGEGGVALHDLMKADDFVPADVADKHLSALKAITRDAALPTVMDESQGLAAKAIGQLEPQLDAAMSQMPPSVAASLDAGRQATKNKHAIADLIQDVSGNKEGDISKQIMNRMTAPGDYNVDSHLKPVLDALPHMKDKIGNAFLNDLFAQAVRDGGFQRDAGVIKKWTDMGPKTKDLIYGPKAKSIDAFIELAQRMNWNTNPSGTAKTNILTKMLPFAGHGAVPLAMAHFVSGPVGVATFIGQLAATRQLGKVLLQPGGADKLNNLIRFGYNSAKGQAARAAVKAIVTDVSHTDN